MNRLELTYKDDWFCIELLKDKIVYVAVRNGNDGAGYYFTAEDVAKVKAWLEALDGETISN